MRDWYKDIVQSCTDIKQRRSFVDGYITSLKQDGETALSCDLKSRTLLHLAAFSGNIERVRQLLEDGSDINKQDISGFTALHHAVILGDKDLVNLLIEKGGDVHAITKEGFSLLHYAGREGHKEIVELLIKECVNPFVRSINQDEALDKKKALDISPNHQIKKMLRAYESVCNEFIKAVNALSVNNADTALRKGASINVLVYENRTPLERAVLNVSTELVRLLLENGASTDVFMVDTGATLLGFASSKGLKDIVTLLIRHNADVNQVSKLEYTPLRLASYQRDKDIVLMLLDAGADLNKTD
ncbi:MAG: ankyrin repeat domain-containing protein [Alphaproteobacteria bacterium]|nr:ankyrin repeat domain-containing protein [Candidatus Jidaibacter sp.]